MKVVRRRRATEDIDEHAAYIAARIASRRLDRIIAGLRAFPVRTLRSYVVLYFVSNGSVQIVRVVHASRDLEALLKGP